LDDGDLSFKEGWVKLVWAGHPEALRQMHDDMDSLPDPTEDKPWVKVRIGGAMVSSYRDLRDVNAWEISYRSPPDVVR